MKRPEYLHNSNEMTTNMDYDKLLDQILKTDIMIPLPGDFADKVAMKAIQRMTLKQSLKEFLIYSGVISGIFLTFLSVMYLLDNENVKKWFDFLLLNISTLIGITLVLVFILFLDRVILPQFFIKVEEKKISFITP